MKPSVNRRGGGSWDERGARLQQLSRKDEDLALFQDMRIREQQSLDPTPDHAHGGPRFRAALPTARTRGSNDLLTSETDKNDYDWLLTPPGTPLFPSLDRDWLVPSPTGQRDSSRWPSKLSRVSTDAQLLVSSSSSASSGGSSARLFSTNATTTRGNPSPRRQSAPPPFSASTAVTTTRQPLHKPGGATTTMTSSSTNGVRPSTPTRRPSSAPSLSASTTAPRRPSTPTRASAMTTTTTPSTAARSTGSRPSTPTRPSPASSRPSTPTRRASLTPTSTTTSSVTPASNGRTSRGTSPVRRPQAQATTTGPAPHERSSSNSRASTVSRSPGMDSLSSHFTKSYNNHVDRDMASFSRRAVSSTNDGPKSEPLRKSAAKTCTGTPRETSFYGTSISKKSIDTAIRHMDIRRSTPSGFRAPPATATYPKSSTAIARSQIQQQQHRPDYSRLLSSEQRHDKSLALFEHEVREKPSLFPVQDVMDDSFLLEFSSLTSSAEATFLEEADYLKDP